MTSDQLAVTESDTKAIVERVGLHLPEWKYCVESSNDLTIKRLSGLSNACFRVELTRDCLKKVKESGNKQPDLKVILYRRFEQDLTDKRVEQAVFLTKSEDGTGPHLYFQNKEYRVEGFFEGRPISIWEMRNPLIYKKYADMICDFNFDKKL